ncbi:porin [Azoarcus sp. TTM-91]|uniref:porin n=1 Tax=Azoarcus sp. TTM-91 TaxID=2691581 RepID=UPI00145F96A5|nr:porin [Azoarcus sp. TTM-91]NMG33077.1 porin [Azoarcus sp. TTM-91]
MQKKLIALAVAGLMSAPAFAQSNVTIYGVVDYGYQWTGDSRIDGLDSRSALDGGVSAGNRIGFKGTEDLGNGLKAGFVYEMGFGRSETAGGTVGSVNRQSYVSLSGGFGTVALGRQYAPQHLMIVQNIDPFGFGKGTVASLANIYMGDARLDNLAAYVSPNWGGFSFVAGWTNNFSGDETRGNGYGLATSEDGRAWAFSPSYKNGPVYVGLNLHQIHLNSASGNAAGTDAIKVWDLAGTYDFGVVKLGAIYGVRDVQAVAANSDVKFKQWALTAAVPVGAAGKIQASYGRRKAEIDGSSDGKSSQWGIGYEHALSKRTAIYTAYADINNNNAAETAGVAASIGDATGANIASGAYERGFNVGVRHSF